MPLRMYRLTKVLQTQAKMQESQDKPEGRQSSEGCCNAEELFGGNKERCWMILQVGKETDTEVKTIIEAKLI